MATASLISTQHAAASISLARSHPADSLSGSSGSSGSDSGGATISANDFLTLLVTEMQNQDPTADTDPNEYINQLVNVNSLEQLIQINQTLSSDLTTSTGAAPGLPSGRSSDLVHAVKGPYENTPASVAEAFAQPASAPLTAISAQSGAPAPASVTSGNLNIPSSSPAALRVAGALGTSRPRR